MAAVVIPGNREQRRAQGRKPKLSARAQLARQQASTANLLGQAQALSAQLDVQRRHVLRLTQALGGLYVPVLALRDVLAEQRGTMPDAVERAASPFVAAVDAWLQRPTLGEAQVAIAYEGEETLPHEVGPDDPGDPEEGGAPDFVRLSATSPGHPLEDRVGTVVNQDGSKVFVDWGDGVSTTYEMDELRAAEAPADFNGFNQPAEGTDESADDLPAEGEDRG